MKFLAIFFLIGGGVCCSSIAANERPNIVLILADDLAWSDVHCNGHPYHRTPNIDRLATQGMRFTNGYAPAPICSASRASILTGKAVPRLGFEFVTKHNGGHQKLDAKVPLLTPPYTLNLPLSEKTIAEQLAGLGYQTAFFGKWHVSQHYKNRYLAWNPHFGPKQQGFEIAEEDFGDHPYSWKKQTPPDAPDGKFPHDSMIQRTADFIRSKHDRPYFLMASSFYVHTPVRTRCQWLVEQYAAKLAADAPNRKKRLEYAAFVETLDHHVGSILQAIEDSGAKQNTLVVFLSDNGGHPEYCSNAPLRGSKWNLYEGGIRVPFIVRWPQEIRSASTCNEPVIGYDLLPTFVEIAGGRAEGVDGQSLAGLFADPNQKISRSIVWHFPYYHPESTFSSAQDVIGVGDYSVSKTRPQSALRRGKFKLVTFAEDKRVELFDLNADPSESHDLSEESPKLATELNKLLEKRLTEMNARRAVPQKE